MLRYVVVTTVAIVGIMSYADAPSSNEVSRASSPVQGFSLSDLVGSAGASPAALQAPRAAETMSEAEAIDMALAASAAHRADRAAPSLRGLIDAVEAPASETLVAAEEAIDYWFVTGSSVNLRAGPGTNNAVVGQVSMGQKAEVLSDPSASWIEIRTANGDSGWIFGKYIGDSQPG